MIKHIFVILMTILDIGVAGLDYNCIEKSLFSLLCLLPASFFACILPPHFMDAFIHSFFLVFCTIEILRLNCLKIEIFILLGISLIYNFIMMLLFILNFENWENWENWQIWNNRRNSQRNFQEFQENLNV